MSEDIDYASRVQRGIALLDEKWPAWATETNMDTLDIRNPSSCMTAQYAEQHDHEPSWLDGMEMLGIEGNEEYAAHGFNGDSVTPGAYDALNGLWKAAIEARRAGDRPEAGKS